MHRNLHGDGVTPGPREVKARAPEWLSPDGNAPVTSRNELRYIHGGTPRDAEAEPKVRVVDASPAGARDAMLPLQDGTAMFLSHLCVDFGP